MSNRLAEAAQIRAEQLLKDVASFEAKEVLKEKESIETKQEFVQSTNALGLEFVEAAQVYGIAFDKTLSYKSNYTDEPEYQNPQIMKGVEILRGLGKDDTPILYGHSILITDGGEFCIKTKPLMPEMQIEDFTPVLPFRKLKLSTFNSREHARDLFQLLEFYTVEFLSMSKLNKELGKHSLSSFKISADYKY